MAKMANGRLLLCKKVTTEKVKSLTGSDNYVIN